MIRIVADCGAQIAKFQLFRPEQYPHNIAVPEDWIDSLRETASKAGIGLLFSVFYPTRYQLGAVKIAYSQRHNFALIKYCQDEGMRLIVSGDQNTWWPDDCIKLACVPKYPAQPHEYENLEGHYDGLSDHTVGLGLVEQIKPRWVEKHFKLGDEGDRSPDAGDFAITPKKLRELLGKKMFKIGRFI